MEADGLAFHENKPAQLKRDRMKDRILEKYRLPLLRLSRGGSREKEKIKRHCTDVWKIFKSV